MLLQAIHLAAQGGRVCVVDRERNLGGSWRVGNLRNGEKVEIACHLVEFFPGVYDVLQRMSGAEFSVLENQPVRVHSSGLSVAYISRAMLLITGVRLLVGLFVSLVKAKANIANAADVSEDVLNFRTKWRSFYHYQLASFWRRPILYGPKKGYVFFVEQLVTRCRQMKVEFLHAEVAKCEWNEGVWELATGSRFAVFARRVHSSTSINLKHLKPGEFVASPLRYKVKACVVVEVRDQDIRINQTYVAFWKDKFVSRISRVDTPGRSLQRTRFLVEFRTSLDKVTAWRDIAFDRLIRARVIDGRKNSMIVGTVDCTYVSNMEQMPVGKIDHNFYTYYSYGNLAAGIAAWSAKRNARTDTINTSSQVT